VIDPVLTGTRTQSLGLTVVDDVITEVTFGVSNNIETLAAFYEWVSEHHPDVAEEAIACVNPGICLLPVLTVESAELHRTMVEEYVALWKSTLGESTLTDDVTILLENYQTAFDSGDSEALRTLFVEDARRTSRLNQSGS
jgi:hypothetical protein